MQCLALRKTHAPCKPPGVGFTLMELLVTLAILAVLSVLVVPAAQVQMQRSKEQQLRAALVEIRSALDAYKKASDEGRIPKDAGASGYPASLEVLVEGVEDQRDPKRRKLFFLRRIPRDPFSDDADAADASTWAKRAYATDASFPAEGDDVYDVFSRSPRTGLNGIALKRW
jgi:general secretion pathway protein G